MDFNGTTSSLLVYYNPAEVDHKHILSILQGAKYYDPARTVLNDQLIHSTASKAMHGNQVRYRGIRRNRAPAPLNGSFLPGRPAVRGGR